MANDGRIYTAGERFQIARLAIKGGRQAVQRGSEHAVDARIDNALDRIEDRAATRYQREAGAAFGQLEATEDEVARSKAALRAARGPEKSAARQAHNDAKGKQRRADRAARKYL
jgi:hypothetical protein